MDHAALTSAIAARCAAAGLDLSASCAAADYNQRVAEAYRLPDFGRARALVIIIGNTRAMWRHVLADAATRQHPVDEHVASTIRAAVADVTAPHGIAYELRFSPEPPPRRVAMQQLADVTGLAWLSPSHFNVHPTFGTWIGLRAAIVLDVEGPPPRSAPTAPCDCSRGCGPAFERAIAAGTPRGADELRERWRLWLAVRDACPVGREHRYSDAQIRYHYTGDRTALTE